MAYLGTAPAKALATTEQIGDGAVQTADIANAAVTLAKLNATGTPSSATFLRGDNTWADSGAIGVGQTWTQFVVGTTRVKGTTYTNTSTKPIQVIIAVGANASADTFFYINGVVVHQLYVATTAASSIAIATAIIPVGSTYAVTGGVAGLSTWWELR